MTIAEMQKEYGLSETELLNMRASCSMTLQCATHSVSCTSSKGDCRSIKKGMINDQGELVQEIVVEIVCDDKRYSCNT